MTSLPLDVRFAARSLVRRPGFAAAVVLALALGVGANTALVSLADALLFRGLPYRDAERLVRLYPVDEKGESHYGFSYPEVADLASHGRALDRVVAWSSGSAVDFAAGGQQPGRAYAALVGGGYFPLLGVEPEHGRLLAPADDRAGAPPVAVLAEPFWRRTFGGDPSIVGRAVRINRQLVEVVGIAPRGFLGVSLDDAPDVWLPLAQVLLVTPQFAAARPLETTNFRWLDAVARLAPGATAETVRAEAERLRRDLARRVGDDDLAPHVRVVPAGEALVAEGSRPLAMRTAWLLFAAGALVLALAGLAAGVLLLLRGEQRHRELAVRRSIGAGGGALLRVLSAEAAMLGALGVAAGVALAIVWQRALVALLPADFPLLPAAVENALGPRLLVTAAAAGLFVALLAGAVPAWRARRRDPAQSLKGEVSVDAAGWRLPLRSGLVVVQVALSVVLLSAAGLLLRTLWQASRVDSGISTRGVVLASLDLSRQGYDEGRGARFWEELLARLEAAPGVEAAALGKQVPVSGSGMYVTMQPEGYEIPDGERAGTSFNVVSAGYFRALEVPIVEGRGFAAGDRAGAPLVAVVNEAFVRQYWRGKSALGRSIADVGPRGEGVSVVGVARDVRAYSLREEASPTLFVPLQQSYLSGLTAIVKGQSGTDRLQATLRATVAGLDADMPLFDQKTLATHVGSNLERERALAVLLGGLGGLALLLTLLGIYAVLAFVTARRVRELGVRRALGAGARSLASLVLRHGLGLTVAGVVLGAAAAAVLNRSLGSLLFGVGVLDPWAYVLPAALLLVAAASAAWLPARRAASVDPMLALRSDVS